MPKPNLKEIKQVLINDFGYQPVDLESYTGQLRALKESLNSLKIKNSKDPRIQQLTNAIKDLKADREVEKSGGKLKHTRKRRSDSKSYEQIKAEIDAKDKAIADRKAAKKAEARLLGIEKRVENNSTKITLLKNILKAQKTNVGEKLKGLEPVNSPLNESIQSITDSVTSIHQALIDQQELDKGQQDDIDIDAEQDKRDAKETSREGGGIGEGLKKTGEKMLAPVKKGLGSIIDWFKKFLMAKAVMMFFNWFSDPANKKKVSTLFRFIKDWWPAILTGLLLFAGSMLGPTGIIIGIGALVIGFIPKIVNSIKSLFGFTKDVNKEAAKGEKEAAKAEKLADKQDKKDISEELKPEDDVGDAPEPGTTPLEPPAKEFNKGGEVPGKGDKDTVPAMLTPGEFVMSKGAVEQYGVKTLEGMNAAAGGTNKPEEGIDSIKPMKGGGPVMPQTPMVRGYSGGGEVKPPEEVKVEDKKKQAPELNKETGKLAKRIEPLVTAQPPGMGGIGGALMSVAEKHPAVMLAKGIGKFIGKGMGKVGDMMKKKEPDLDLKEAIADLQKRFNYSIYDGNYKPQGGVVSEPKESGGGGSDPLAGFVSAVSTLPIVGKPLAKATGVLVSGVEKIIDDKLQLSGNQSGTATPDAPTKPTTTVAYQDAQAAAQGGGGGGGYSAGAGGKVPQFSASAKLSKQKIKVLGISR
jgi:uncharacterized membrane protein